MSDAPRASPGLADLHITCATCAYDLTGLRADGLCPECATPVIRSLPASSFSSASHAHLHELSTGLGLIITALTLQLVFSITNPCLCITSSNVVLKLPVLIFLAIGFPPLLLILVGFRKASSPDSHTSTQTPPTHASAASTPLRSRLLGAIYTCVFARASLTFSLAIQPPPAYGLTPDTWGVLIGSSLLLEHLAWAAIHALGAVHMRTLALRVPDAALARTCTTNRWLLPTLSTLGVLIAGLGPAIAVSMHWRMIDRLKEHIDDTRNA